MFLSNFVFVVNNPFDLSIYLQTVDCCIVSMSDLELDLNFPWEHGFLWNSIYSWVSKIVIYGFIIFRVRNSNPWRFLTFGIRAWLKSGFVQFNSTYPLFNFNFYDFIIFFCVKKNISFVFFLMMIFFLVIDFKP